MKPITPETRSRIVELIEAGGMGRNAIAREAGVSGGMVTKIARQIGHEFDWKDIEVMVEARKIQTAEIRSALAQAALLEAVQTLGDMRAPALRVDFSPATEHRDAEYHEHVSDEPTFSDRRNLATIFGILVSRAADLSRATAAAGDDEVISYIDGLKDALNAVEARIQGSPDPTEEPTMRSREQMLADLEADVATPEPEQ